MSTHVELRARAEKADAIGVSVSADTVYRCRAEIIERADDLLDALLRIVAALEGEEE
jgi:hypothetical protein